MNLILFIALVAVCYAVLFIASMRGRETLLIVLGVLCAISFLFAGKIVNVAGYPLVPSAPIVAIIFYSGTLLQEFYGARAARKLLFINLGTMAGMTALGALVNHMTIHPLSSPDQLQLSGAFDTLFAFFPQALGAALIAFSSAYALNFVLTRLLHKMCGSRLFALRSFLSVALSNLLDITAFVGLAYAWSDSTPSTILTTWTIRLICILVGIPMMWAIKVQYRKRGVVEEPILV